MMCFDWPTWSMCVCSCRLEDPTNCARRIHRMIALGLALDEPGGEEGGTEGEGKAGPKAHAEADEGSRMEEARSRPFAAPLLGRTCLTRKEDSDGGVLPLMPLLSCAARPPTCKTEGRRMEARRY